MPPLTIPSETVPGWSPRFEISPAVTEIKTWDRARAKGPLDMTHFAEAYEAPAITFTPLGRTTVPGNSFCVRGEELGVLRESLTLVGGAMWAEVVVPGDKLVSIDNEEPALVCGNLAVINYYHWTLQCLANLLVYRRLTGSDDFTAIVPTLTGFRAQLVALSDFCGRTVEIEADEVLTANHGIYGNLCGGAFSFAPHPATMAEFDALAAEVEAERSFGKRIYASRLDARNMRGVVNEEAVCDLMLRHGFEIITPGELSVEEQIAAFRDADVIVSPHGAGLANLVYCRTGSRTRVVELLQSSYIPGSYIRICQAKGLDYTGIVSSDAVPLDENGNPLPQRNFNNINNAVDLDLLDKVLSGL